MAILVKKAWFGPKQSMGWGLSPASRAGVFTLGLFGIAIAISAYLSIAVSPAVGTVAIAIVLLAFVAVLALTSDKPGGPGM